MLFNTAIKKLTTAYICLELAVPWTLLNSSHQFFLDVLLVMFLLILILNLAFGANIRNLLMFKICLHDLKELNC